MEIFITDVGLAELLGLSHQTVRRFRWPKGEGRNYDEETGFPQPWGTVLEPGKTGARKAVFAFSEVMDWLAEHRPYDLRIGLELGSVGRELGRLDERRHSGSKPVNEASNASS